MGGGVASGDFPFHSTSLADVGTKVETGRPVRRLLQSSSERWW